MNDILLPQLQQTIGAAGVVLLFLLLHLLAGFFARSGKPLLWQIVEGAGAEIDRRLNRKERSPGDLFLRGIVVSVVMLAFGFLIGAAVEKISTHDYGWIAGIVFLSLTVSAMGPLSVLRRLVRQLAARETKQAVATLQPFAGEDVEKLDEHSIIRRSVEYSALSLNTYFIAPLFWFTLLGATGLAVYLMIVALYEVFGMDDSRHLMFGGIVRGLEKILDFIPARLTALAIIIAALFVSRSNPWLGLSTAFSQARFYRSVNRGWIIAAMAGGLGVTLGGPLRHIKGHTIEHGWIGPAGSSAKASLEDLRRVTMLHFVVFLCTIVAFSVVILMQNKFT